jgi:hypothetical protein
MKPTAMLSAVAIAAAVALLAMRAEAQASIDSVLVRRAAARWVAERLLGEVRGGRVALDTQTGGVVPPPEQTESLRRILGASAVLSCGDRTATCAMKDFRAIVTISVDSLGESGALATVTIQRPAAAGPLPSLQGQTLRLRKRADCRSVARVVAQSAS